MSDDLHFYSDDGDDVKSFKEHLATHSRWWDCNKDDCVNWFYIFKKNDFMLFCFWEFFSKKTMVI